MPRDAREMMAFLAAGYEKLADGMEGKSADVLGQLPENASEYDRGYLSGPLSPGQHVTG
jgi:hypothetical protein